MSQKFRLHLDLFMNQFFSPQCLVSLIFLLRIFRKFEIDWFENSRRKWKWRLLWCVRLKLMDVPWILNIWWPMPLFWVFYFIDWYWDEYILRTVILLGGCMEVWTWSSLDACLFWSCFDVIVVKVKVSRGIMPFFPMWSTVRTNHIYFQITQPGSSTVTSLSNFA